MLTGHGYTAASLGMKFASTMAGVLLTVIGVNGAELVAPAPFAVGEKLHYRVVWGPLTVGAASLEVRGLETVNGRLCYHFVAEAHTTGPGRLLYRFDTTAESWTDMHDLSTLRHRNQTTEGKRTTTEEILFDYDRHVATTTNLTTGTARTCRLDGPTVDVIGALYAVRSRPLLQGVLQRLTVNASATNYNVSFRPDQPQTMELRPVGIVPALRVEPQPTLKLIAGAQGRLWFWVSADARRLPLIAVTEIKIGSGRMVLTKIETSPPPATNQLAAAY
jgi:hypothetical protein